MYTNTYSLEASSNFVLRHGLPKLVYKTCAHKRRDVDLIQFLSD